MVNKTLIRAVAWISMFASAAASPLVMSGDDALVLAARLVDAGDFDDADVILRQLASSDPTLVDMRAVDRLAAKIAFARGDTKRAIKILTAVAASDPDDWRTHFDLAHVAQTAKRDRLARRHFLTVLNNSSVPAEAKAHARTSLRQLAERQVVRVSFAATAAPSTNINSATRDETFDFAGFIPFDLSDDARAQSGLGVNWSMGGTISPPIRGKLRGHFAANSTVTDYSHSGFDGTASQLEAGFRNRLRLRGAPTDVTVAATYAHRTFGGDDYSIGLGGRIAVRAILGPQTAVSISFSAADLDYIARHDRDGWMTQGVASIQHAISPRTQVVAGLNLAREDAVAGSETNNRVGLFAGTFFQGPYGLRLGVQPSIYFRSYDAASFTYGTVRKDTLGEVALSANHPRLTIGGLRPSLIYRYTSNNSSVSLFDYDRHGLDVSFARAF